MVEKHNEVLDQTPSWWCVRPLHGPTLSLVVLTGIKTRPWRVPTFSCRFGPIEAACRNANTLEGCKCYAGHNCKLVTCMPFAWPHDIPGGASGYHNTALTCADGAMPARSDRDRMSQR